MSDAEIDSVENAVLSCFNSNGNLAQDQYAIGRIQAYFDKLRKAHKLYRVEEPEKEAAT